jgi:hypothetical protein
LQQVGQASQEIMTEENDNEGKGEAAIPQDIVADNGTQFAINIENNAHDREHFLHTYGRV